MPLSNEIVYVTSGTKDSINLDPSISPFNVNVAFTLSGGTVSYKLQYSLSGPNVADSSALWFDSADFPAATAASKVAAISAPVARVRAVIAALSGGTLTLQILQGMSIN